MTRRWRNGLSSAAATLLVTYVVFVHLYMRLAEPFTPEPVAVSLPALILGLPIGLLAATIVLAVVLAFHEVRDRA